MSQLAFARIDVREQISGNRRRTFLLMVVFALLVAVVVEVISLALGWGYAGGIVAFVIALVYIAFSYFSASSMVLGISRAKAIEKQDDRELYNIVENLCIGAGIPIPKIHVIQDDALNAFATGRDPAHAHVAITTGLRRRLDRIELEGVMAHELSHIRNYDIRLMLLAVALIGVISIVAQLFFYSLIFGGVGGRRRHGGGSAGGGSGAAMAIIFVVGLVVVILAPVIARMISLAVSRQREYLADASGALLSRYPEGLASALEKIAGDSSKMEHASDATSYLFISNPFHRNLGSQSLFATHPPLSERIRRLRAM